MSKATCRCGQSLKIPGGGVERVVCPKCGARIRLRRPAPVVPADGYLRFFCPCGRRLKVAADQGVAQGKCPDCGRIVPVPTSSASAESNLPPGHPEAGTIDLSPEEAAGLDRWSSEWAARQGAASPDRTPIIAQPSPAPSERAEAGLRVCPKCKKPIHLGADVCRACGTSVPRR